MSNDSALVRTDPAHTGPIIEHRVHLNPEDPILHRPVEVVTAEEERLEEQVKHRVKIPSEFFKRGTHVDPPLAPGATVNVESLLGFLAALGEILPEKVPYPILESAKLWYDPPPATLYIEAGSHAVWSVVALRASAGEPKGFTAMMPVHRARNVLGALREAGPTVVVGVDAHGICLGPHTVPFGGLIDDFPVQPVIEEWIARAVMPAFYYREICNRVLLARTQDFKDDALQGVLLDFEAHDIDGATKVLCTAVATDGCRIHILRLPQMALDIKQRTLRSLPPTCTVPAGFFRYMKAIVQHEWSALEFGDKQLVARGEDFVVVAKVATEGKAALRELASWRRVNTEWPGYWLASNTKLTELVTGAMLGGTAEEVRLQIHGNNEELVISSQNDAGERFTEKLQVRGFDGPNVVDVSLSPAYLKDALIACLGGLVRLSFTRDLKDQPSAPVVIRGEDEQFKAIIMPRHEENQ